MLRTQTLGLAVLLLALAGFAAWATSTRIFTADFSYGHANSLTATSRKVLASLSEPTTITAFVQPESVLEAAERRLLERYTRADPRIRLRFVNPDTALPELRKLGITTSGELYVQYGKRGEKLDDVSETGITNALLRLSRGANERVVFVTGHGEASPEGDRNYDLGHFGAALQRQGFKIRTQNLADDPRIDAHTALVVIAGPQQPFLPGEIQTLERWVNCGGNLLWLSNPGPLNGLGPIAHILGVKPLAGTIVDATSSSFGIKDPTWLVITEYGASPVTRDFALNTLFPDATGFEVTAGSGWHSDIFIQSRRLPASWLITGELEAGHVLYRPGIDVPGPVPIAIALSRTTPGSAKPQRAAVVGDVNFLADSFLGNGGNLNLGLNLVNWLSDQDRYLNIAAPQAPDRVLILSKAEQGGIGIGYLIVLPLLFLIVALFVWLRRRRS
ncbi:MAG: GldG family protein [Gammaproteobacteria bacterium]